MVMVVGLLGLFSTIILLNDPPSNSDLDVTPPIFEINTAKLMQVSQRGLASVAAEASTQTQAPNIVDVPCGTNDLTVETQYTRMRLKGENCVSNNSPKTEIKNTSNGYVATVFHKQDFSFTTDYINLVEGMNEINLVFETPEGVASQRKIVINRAPASAPSKN